ncbi:hypothetical protein VIGAN_04165000 [Vigna angularis var. angularis]|uniref:Uncharacterized protein n=1 Tax=Vigna angularis var. angularis TaxID=157739 RepID=A0A0S3RUR8_PHAAN|nr:hypothetical protein VIGAN_04165000 [Vigna angularis var. angularis]
MEAWVKPLGLKRVKLGQARSSFVLKQPTCRAAARAPPRGCLGGTVRNELEQLMHDDDMVDDDDDMANLYLSRKGGSSSPVSGSSAANWFAASPTIGSKIYRANRASPATVRLDENDVKELEMLLEVMLLASVGNAYYAV